MKYQTYLIFGAPGSGKGTQGRTLGTIPRYCHCACGDVKGQLVPDEITVKLWQARIRDNVGMHVFKPDIDFLILDGIPRNVNQARLMEEMIEVRHVFHLTCPDRNQLIERLKKRALKDNRLDDANEEVIRKRLATYEAESKPILEYYPAEIVHTIDATQLPIMVFQEILKTVCEDQHATV
jgi:adenylate kinase